ncbi:MAG: 30S ribosome-binding factor RbfA [bacterium]
MKFRLNRIESLIKEEISLIFLYKLQDPDFRLITITEVKVSHDLKYAKIYISVYDKENRKKALEKANKIKGMIRMELASKMKSLRTIPDITFYIDETLDYVEKIDGLFRKIHEDDNKTAE